MRLHQQGQPGVVRLEHTQDRLVPAEGRQLHDRVGHEDHVVDVVVVQQDAPGRQPLHRRPGGPRSGGGRRGGVGAAWFAFGFE